MPADHDFYLSRLYPLQDRILTRLASIDTGFYLTGGTAASRGYLHHRFSDDLDFFVNDDDRFGLWAQRVAQALVSSREWTVAVGQQEQRFFRLTVTEGDVVLKIEMINDVPAHVGPLKRDPVLGLLDSAENILANKLTRSSIAGSLGIWPTSGASAVDWACPLKPPWRTHRARPPGCSRRTLPARS